MIKVRKAERIILDEEAAHEMYLRDKNGNIVRYNARLLEALLPNRSTSLFKSINVQLEMQNIDYYLKIRKHLSERKNV